MKERLFYVKEGKLFFINDNGKSVAVPDGIFDGYVRRMTEASQRTEWKTQGAGAKFTGVYEPGSDTASRISNITSKVVCAQGWDGKILFSERIEGTGAIYRKLSVTDLSEVVAISDSVLSLAAFDIAGDKIAISAENAGVAHIATADLSSRPNVRVITEGDSVDTNPSWDKSNSDILYYESAGISNDEKPDEKAAQFMTPMQIMQYMNYSYKLGPSAIVRINFKTGDLDYILESNDISYIKPATDREGNLYYIEKPYDPDRKSGSGCLKDILLFPVRLFRAIFGFFNFFSIKYSGSALSNNGTKAKSKDQQKLFIDGNLIDAERALKENANDENPGIIPRSFKLCRRTPDGKTDVLKCGVIAYTVCSDGTIVCSNGKHIIKLSPDGREERILTEDNVTYLSYIVSEL